MTPIDKAKDLYNKYAVFWHDTTETCKKQCLIAVDELIQSYSFYTGMHDQEYFTSEKEYWEQVKEAINAIT